jgi:hypothetical protein
MAIRFRKSIKLAPGVRLNLSGSGASWTFGPKGASVGVGKRGTYLNAGIPGSGLYTRQALTSERRSPGRTSASAVGHTRVSLTVSVSDDGEITFKDSNGQPVPDAMIAAAKKQQGEAIKALIQSKCDEINAQVTALGELHHDSPPPHTPPAYRGRSFDVAYPTRPVPKVPGFFAKLFRGAQIASENAKAQAAYEAALRKWETDRARFDAEEGKKQDLIARALAGDPQAMEDFFGEVLSDVAWPRETLVSFEVQDAGTRLSFDVDLPEVEDMPAKTASVPQRGLKLSVKEMGPTAVQKLYAQHVHSIAFRLLGEAFGMLPTVQEVVLSAYSQRKNKATGHEADEYLLSAAVPRAAWEKLNFSDLPAIDVLNALALFQLRRSMTKTGVFAAVQPF